MKRYLTGLVERIYTSVAKFYTLHRNANELFVASQTLLKMLGDSRAYNQTLITENAILKETNKSLIALKKPASGEGLGWPEGLDSTSVSFWVCPNAAHHDPHKVSWENGIASCEWPDCHETSKKERDDVPARPAD